MSKTYSLENHYKVWNDKTGTKVEIGPDRDGLNLVEMREFSDDGKELTCVVFTPEQAELVATALLAAVRDAQTAQEEEEAARATA